MAPLCLACRWVRQPVSKQTSCELTHIPISDPSNSFCGMIVNEIDPAIAKFNSDHSIETDHFYIWVEVDGQRDHVALASLETVGNWSDAEQLAMCGKRAQLHEYFKRSMR